VFAFGFFARNGNHTEATMKVKVFAVPFDATAKNFDNRELHAFLQDKRVIGLSDHLLESPAGAFVCLVMSYEEVDGRAAGLAAAAAGAGPAGETRAAAPEPPKPKKAAPPEAKVDGGSPKPPATDGSPAGTGAAAPPRPTGPTPPPEHLTPAQKAMYTKIRRWRYNRAAQLGIPPYMILSNNELTRLVERLPRSTNDLLASECVSGARAKQYGLEIVTELGRAIDEAAKQTGGAGS
jgi:hypothetical protein